MTTTISTPTITSSGYRKAPKLSSDQKDHDRQIRARIAELKSKVSHLPRLQEEFAKAKETFERTKLEVWPEHPRYIEAETALNQTVGRCEDCKNADRELRRLERTEDRALGRPWLPQHEADKNDRLRGQIETMKAGIARLEGLIRPPYEPV